MAWGRSTARARAAAERRLADLADEWRPRAERTHRADAAVDDRLEEPSSGVALLPRGRSAARGLAVLVALVVAIAGYGVWMGRPRAVTEVPVVLASGVPVVAGPSPVDSRAEAPSEALPSSAPSPVGEVVVHVVGLVRRPGVVRLAAGARVEDAVAAAGGVTRRRAEGSVNLARVLVDGEQIVVTDTPAASTPAGTTTPSSAVVDLNTATAESLDALPGIGPVIAARIVAWRTSNGPFRSVDELGEVSGIGDAILGQVRSLVRV